VVSKSGFAAFRAVRLSPYRRSYFRLRLRLGPNGGAASTTWERLSERHSLSARKAAEPLTAYRLLTTDY